MKKTVDIPLGKILHIVDGEAITRPDEIFVANGADVVTLTNKKIGRLRYPFGPVAKPYQPIKLKKPNDTSLIGELVIAQVRKNKRN